MFNNIGPPNVSRLVKAGLFLVQVSVLLKETQGHQPVTVKQDHDVPAWNIAAIIFS
jgi:hypothetical protein